MKMFKNIMLMSVLAVSSSVLAVNGSYVNASGPGMKLEYGTRVAENDVKDFNKALTLLVSAAKSPAAMLALFELLNEKLDALVADDAACQATDNILSRIEASGVDLPGDIAELLEDAKSAIAAKRYTTAIVARKEAVADAMRAVNVAVEARELALRAAQEAQVKLTSEKERLALVLAETSRALTLRAEAKARELEKVEAGEKAAREQAELRRQLLEKRLAAELRRVETETHKMEAAAGGLF